MKCKFLYLCILVLIFNGSTFVAAGDLESKVGKFSQKYVHLEKRGDNYYFPSGECKLFEGITIAKERADWVISINDFGDGFVFTIKDIVVNGNNITIKGHEKSYDESGTFTIKPHSLGLPYLSFSGPRVRSDGAYVGEKDKDKVKKIIRHSCPEEAIECQGCKETLEK